MRAFAFVLVMAVSVAASGLEAAAFAQRDLVVTHSFFPGLGLGRSRSPYEWITSTFWKNQTGKPITSFVSTWKVPTEPTTHSGQLIYLFNGLVPADRSEILQPVLQWGSSEAGGGEYWSVASWYVSSSGQSVHTEAVPVHPGDTLVGVMTLTGGSNGSFSYQSEFQGIAATRLAIQDAPELSLATETLEAYGVQECSNYPGDMAYTGIGLRTADGPPSLTWDVRDQVSDCGQHITVVSNSSTNGEVDIHMH